MLPEGEATRVGATRARPVDVRVVAATSVDLERCLHCSAKQRRRERSNGRTTHRASRSAARRSAISRDQISIKKITIWYTLARALQSGLLPAATPVVPTLFQKFAT
ncbi:sigma 54-interacting transcriptional regulator [Burkholderia ubonensis]|uniref:sigma 54-interacting transcriptional regulator n=1 Tax=Burkholderia ubonensis TaxID=101571 RepID=UPI0039F20A48